MTSSLYLPTDAVNGPAIDFDLAADFLELAAFFSAFSADSTVATSDLANTTSIAAAEDHIDLEKDTNTCRRPLTGLHNTDCVGVRRPER